MANFIDKETLAHLAELARITLDPTQEEKLLKDFHGILAHFEELGKVDTEEIKPMTGGTASRNEVREDVAMREDDASLRRLTGAFPEQQNGFLKVPPVFK